MVTVKTEVTYILAGRSGEDLRAYQKHADTLEKAFKAAGIFWGREDSTTAITVTSQEYVEVPGGTEELRNGEEE